MFQGQLLKGAPTDFELEFDVCTFIELIFSRLTCFVFLQSNSLSELMMDCSDLSTIQLFTFLFFIVQQSLVLYFRLEHSLFSAVLTCQYELQ